MTADPKSDELTDAMLKARQAFIDAVAAWCAYPAHCHEPRFWDGPGGPAPALSLGLRSGGEEHRFSIPTLRFRRAGVDRDDWEDVS